MAGKYALYLPYHIITALETEGFSNTEIGTFVRGVIKYHLEGTPPRFEDRSLNLLFSSSKPEFDNNIAKYENTVHERSEAGKKGGAPKGNRNAAGNRGGGAPRGNRNAVKREAPNKDPKPDPENKDKQMFEFEPKKQTQAKQADIESVSGLEKREEFNAEKIPEPPQEPPENQTPSTAEAVVLNSSALFPENPGNLPAPQNRPPAFSPVDSPPKKRRKLELAPEQNGLYQAAKACFESSDRARAIIYQDQPSAEMQMRKLKEIVIRCSNIAPGITVDFLKTVLEHFRVMTNSAQYKGKWVFTPRCLSTYWIWEIVISSLPERETELDRNIQESIKGLFKKRQ